MTAPLATRADLQAWTRALLAPALSRLSPGSARADLGTTGSFYGRTGIELEGYARPLWGLTPLLLGDPSSTGFHPRIYDLATGLAHGTDPAHPEFWGWPADSDPRLVEMAALAFALRLHPDLLWTPLDSAARARVVTWLSTINQRRIHASNWLFFRVLVNEALHHLGVHADLAQAARDLDDLESFYLGDGWYSDGPTGACDHYNGFAFHFYGLLYAVWAADRDPLRAARFRTRAAEFACDFVGWFAADGSALPFGRSLAYRFGAAAFWSAAAYAGLDVFTPGQLRGLVLRHLRWWDATAMRSPDGMLSLGYAYPNLHTTEIYNSPSSPYWALKPLLVLALPAEHPFWTSPEEPLPANLSLVPRPTAGGRALLSRSSDGHATLLNPGQSWGWDGRNYPAKYARFAYSTRYAFSVPHGDAPLEACAPDSSLLVSLDGQRWHGRAATRDHLVAPDHVASTWEPLPGVVIRTRLEPAPDGHHRIHEITTPHPLHVVEGGFAAPRGPEPLASLALNPSAGHAAILSPGHAEWRHPGGTVAIIDTPVANAAPREARLVEPWPNTHLLYPSTVVPALVTTLTPGQQILRCQVFGA